MEDFEPPKYIASLIAAVNDGAKSAQASAFLFLAVGLYLLATAFSASDEDLLLGKAVTISQIGASLPVSFSFAIAPLVFVFLHIYTLVRYDLLAANVRQFREELRNTVPVKSDRERCRQLLANVEFIVVLTTPRSSALYSRFWPWLFRGIVAVFPVAVLLLVQINALRYQSDLIVWVQRIWLALDLAALIWFFRRNALDGSPWPEQRPARVRRWAGLLLAPVFIGAVNLFYLNTVPAAANPKLVHYNQRDGDNPQGWLDYAAGDPLDLLFCPRLNWGCRFLRVDHRTLVDKVRDEKALGVLRIGIREAAQALGGTPEKMAEEQKAERAKALAAIEGVFLRDRSLRFAVLAESRLYAAELLEADLRGASLFSARLDGANLRGANLYAADLRGANLRGANLFSANLRGGNLHGANLNDTNLGAAYLSDAALRGADLRGADLRGATLIEADLIGANLNDTNLGAAYLSDAYLRRANLRGANLYAADLRGADLNGANLYAANLTGGADLTRANLSDTYLIGANLTGANLSDARNLIQQQLNPACGRDVKLPPGLTLKPCPPPAPVAPTLNRKTTP
jgi:uncharacterized protein YjbI with pentapeptide repeats